VDGSAADHHAGISIDTIIRASSFRSTERPICTLRPCRRAETDAGRALGRSGAVHRANIALSTTFPAACRPPPGVEHHGGEVHAHPPTGSGALRTILLPFVFQEGGGTASQRHTGDWVWVEYRQVRREVPPSFPRLQQYVHWAASVSGDVHFAFMRNSGLGKDLAEKGLCAKVPILESRLLTRHGVVAKEFHRPSA